MNIKDKKKKKKKTARQNPLSLLIKAEMLRVEGKFYGKLPSSPHHASSENILRRSFVRSKIAQGWGSETTQFSAMVRNERSSQASQF